MQNDSVLGIPAVSLLPLVTAIVTFFLTWIFTGRRKDKRDDFGAILDATDRLNKRRESDLVRAEEKLKAEEEKSAAFKAEIVTLKTENERMAIELLIFHRADAEHEGANVALGHVQRSIAAAVSAKETPALPPPEFAEPTTE